MMYLYHIMNKYIINIVKKIFPKELPKPMGRWRLENSDIQTHHKIDLSNEDHCGPCGQYVLSKIKINNDNKQNIVHFEKNNNF